MESQAQITKRLVETVVEARARPACACAVLVKVSEIFVLLRPVTVCDSCGGIVRPA